MAHNLSLDERQLRIAIEILEREQQAIKLSPCERLLHHVFRAAVATQILLLVLILFAEEVIPVLLDRLPLVTIYLWIALLVLGLLLLLLLVNRSLMRKLWRQSNRWRRLELPPVLTSLLQGRQQRRRRRWAYTFSFASLVVAAVAWYLLEWTTLGEYLSVVGTLLVAIVSVMVLFLTYRGKQRIDGVARLRREMTAKREEVARGEDRQITAARYEEIAGIEREQIVRRRYRNLREGAEEKVAYSIQQSHAVLQEKAALDLATRSQVDQQMFALVTNPRPPGVEGGEQADLILRILGTPLELHYRIEQRVRRIRVFRLTTAEKEGEHREH